jgi:DNA processing protein
MASERDERAAIVALLRGPARPRPQLAAEILEAGSALAVLEAQTPATLFDVGAESVPARLAGAAAEIAGWEAAGIGVHGLLDESYPELLRDIRERPALLFSRGVLRSDPRAIAVVGSRDASEEGRRVAGRIASALVDREITVVSGLAAGIDTAVHEQALAAGGRTVAVIGTGVDQFYPAANRPLQQRISRDGLVLSQFWPVDGPLKHHFPMRNAVMSGYCAATVVVEAGEHSGVRIQTRLALQHGRQVILRDTLLDLEWARALAERPGVAVVADLGQLLAAVDRVLDGRDLQLSGTGGSAGILG